MTIEIDLLVQAGYDLITEFSGASGQPIVFIGNMAYNGDPATTSVLKDSSYDPIKMAIAYARKFKGIIKAIHANLRSARQWGMYDPIIADLSAKFASIQKSDFSFIQQEVENVYSETITFVDKIEDEIEASVSDNLDTVVDMGNQLIDYVDSGVSDVSEKVDVSQQVVVEYIDEQIEGMRTEFSDIEKKGVDYADLLVSGIEKRTQESFKDLTSKITSRIDGVDQKIDDTRLSLTSMIISAVETTNKFVADSLATAKIYYEGKINDVVDSLINVKDDIIELSKPLFSTRSTLINYFIRIIVEAFELMTSSIPDIEL